jgi:polyisoprenoid-binding protein YceI
MARTSHARVALLGLLAAAAIPVAALVAQDASAGQSVTGTFKIDPVHSAAVYRVTHLNTSAHWGMVHEPTGTFTVNPDGTMALDVTMEIAKLDSGNEKRTQHLQGPDFFNAKQFPTMTFKSTGSTKTAEGYTVNGDLTIKGVTKPIEAHVTKVGEGKGMKGEQLAGYEASFSVNRLDYGVNYGPNAIGNEVKVTVAMEGAKQ